MKYKVSLNNKVYEVEVEKGEAMLLDEYDLVMPQAVVAAPIAEAAPIAAPAAAPVASPAAGANVLKSPLPGTVNAIKVSEGQTVKVGDVVLLIEAMKMENEITATSAGTVARILVSKGATVQTGTPLIEFN